ncbi:hypothetical protein DPQ25_07645 [Hydrogeniiclostridium mannosilyticum]|uniref:NEAT domain-containing protein n=1 Tax=Hydrogeniiclostridium mannosilyticum TaxID=2764322 RepID=A0A328UDM7_9FIRM|nr:NEAT domain-containing protein [Hydrogeniiclostridium mannosilyticum]RAQ28663.1 hypothetical protein DPQ25_07645 [Hydrogeniiclostridium mannosilyticum]
MTTTKRSWFKRSLSVLLAVTMVLSMGVLNVFAAEEKCPMPEFYTEGKVSEEGYLLDTVKCGVNAAHNPNGTPDKGYTYYYTTDGSTPTRDNGTKRTTMVTITKVMLKNYGQDGVLTVKVIATKEGMEDSDVATITVKKNPNEPVTISDENLRKAICEALDKEYSEGVTITETEMASLTELVAENAGITDLTGLKYAVNLEVLDLSGNDLSEELNSAAHNSGDIGDLTTLKKLDLSNTNLTVWGEESSKDTNGILSKVFENNPNLESFDISGNNLAGTLSLNISNKKNLAYFDASDNYLSDCNIIEDSGNGVDIATQLPALKSFDFSGNFYQHKETSYGFAVFTTFPEGTLDISNQGSDATIIRVYWKAPSSTAVSNTSPYADVNLENNTADLGDIYGTSLEVTFMGVDSTGKTVATVNGNTSTVITATKSDFAANRLLMSIDGLSLGTNVIEVSTQQENGATYSFNLIVRCNEVPVSEEEDSAGITDPVLYDAVSTALGKAEKGYYTKEDMAKLTSLNLSGGVSNLDGLEYATNLTSLTIGDGEYTTIPGLENMEKLTTLSITSSHVKELPTLAKLSNLTTLTLNMEGMQEAPDLSNQTKLKTLTLQFNGLDQLPDLSPFTALTTLTLGTYSGTYSGLTTDTLDTALEQMSTTVKYVYLYGLTDVESIAISPDKVYGFSTFRIKDCPKLAKISYTAQTNSTNLEIYGQTAPNLDLSGLHIKYKSASTKLNIKVIESKDITIGGTLNEETVLGTVRIQESENIQFSPEFFVSANGVDTLHYTGSTGIVIPENLEEAGLTTLDIYNTNLKEIPKEIFEITSLTDLEFSAAGDFEELPEEIGNLKNLESLSITGGAFDKLPDSLFTLKKLTRLTLRSMALSDLSGNWAGLEALTSLQFQSCDFSEVPDDLLGLVTKATPLTTLTLYETPIADLPEGLLSNLSSLTLGGYFERAYIDNTSDETMIESLADGHIKTELKAYTEKNKKAPNMHLYDNLADLAGIRSDVGNIQFSYNNAGGSGAFTLPEETSSFTFTPYSGVEGTKVTVNGETKNIGESFTVENLKNGLNTVTVTTKNDKAYGGTGAENTYTLSLVVGEGINVDELEEGKKYSIDLRLKMEHQDTYSMADNYFLHTGTVKLADGQYAVELTTNNMAFIGYLDYKKADGSKVRADVINKDAANNTCSYLIYVDNLEDDLYISPMVYPMGYAPTCRVIFDTSSVYELESTGVDFTNLNIAINKAIEITEKRNVYTDASWKNLLEKLEAAQTIAGNDTATQDAVNNAAKELETAMTVGGEGGLVIDESKLANKTALETAINEAKALEKGNHTDTAWNALQEAIADAQAVYDTLEASQNEVDAAAKALNTAVTLFQNSGESSSLDKNNLKDGVYSVYGEMIKTNREEKSMSNDAINHYIKLTVEDGEYYLTMDFHGLAYLNKFGYLAELSYYDNGYTYGEYGTIEGIQIPATVLSTQKNPDGSDLVDEFNQPGGSYAGKLYPDQIKFPLVADALADKDGYVPLHAFVPVMEDISAGTGDQDVLLKLDWSTLKETTEDDPNFKPEEPVEQSPAVDYTDAKTGVKVHADKGVFEEGVQIVVSEITSGTDYDAAASSLSDVGKKFKLYDVKFLDADGNEVAPNGTVSISFPITAGYDSANVAAYRLSDGSKILVKGAVENGYYTVITKTAGSYALVEKGSTITDAQNNQNQGNTNTPQTGDTSNVGAIALLALAAAGMMGVTVITKKRKSEES